MSEIVWPPAALNSQRKGKRLGLVHSAWDEKMCVEHDKAWGRIFAEQMQHLCEALVAGEASAVADFMASEPQRTLQDVLAVRV